MRNKINRFIKAVKKTVGITAISCIMVLLVGMFDYITNPEFSFSLFYLIPISFNTWFSSRRNGILVSIFSAIVWLYVDVSSAQYENIIAPYWNSTIRLGFFSIVVLLLSEIKFLNRNLGNLVDIRTNELTDEIQKKNLAEAELRKAKNLYQDLVENINEVYFTTDEKGNFNYISPNFYKTVQVGESNARDKSFYELIYFEDAERIREYYASMIRKRASDCTCEFRIAASDKTIHWFEQTSRIVWEENEPVGIRNLLKNIDERKAAEISLIKSEMNFQKLFSEERTGPSENDYIRTMLLEHPAYLIKSLAERIDEVSEKISSRIKQTLGFSSLASHELRTPLAIIRNQLEENLREDIPVGTLKETTASIYDEVLRLQRIIGDLLDISKMEAGKIKLQKSVVRLDEFLDSFYQEACLLAQEKGISVILQNVNNICIEIDRAYFLQMLFNIFDNAVKNTSPKGSIYISACNSGDYITISFRDSGKGMSPEIRQKLFTPFYTSGTSSGGTGLGLILSRWIAELHDGKIEIQSEPGKGTTIIMKFPSNI